MIVKLLIRLPRVVHHWDRIYIYIFPNGKSSKRNHIHVLYISCSCSEIYILHFISCCFAVMILFTPLLFLLINNVAAVVSPCSCCVWFFILSSSVSISFFWTPCYLFVPSIGWWSLEPLSSVVLECWCRYCSRYRCRMRLEKKNIFCHV